MWRSRDRRRLWSPPAAVDPSTSADQELGRRVRTRPPRDPPQLSRLRHWRSRNARRSPPLHFKSPKFPAPGTAGAAWCSVDLQPAIARCAQLPAVRQRNLHQPRSRCGKGSYPGRSMRISRPTLSGTAPARARSCSNPGNSSPRARWPLSSSACTCRACGVPARYAGSEGSVSRSRTNTCSKQSAVPRRPRARPCPHR